VEWHEKGNSLNRLSLLQGGPLQNPFADSKSHLKETMLHRDVTELEG